MPAIIFALFGLVIGSFLNVVILRFGSKRSLATGRSACPHCNAALHWYDLIPVASYVALMAKCRYCKAPISPQYPLVETATACLFALVGSTDMPFSLMALSLSIISILVCIFVYDLRHKLIPNLWAWLFIGFSFVFGFYESATMGAVAMFVLYGPLAALPILFLWYLSKLFTGESGMWMGFGDVKLALGIGYLLPWQTSLGIPLGVVAVFLAFIIGAFVSVSILIPLPHIVRFWGLRKGRAMQGYTMKSEVPFGPFLIVSCLILWFFVIYHMTIPFSL